MNFEVTLKQLRDAGACFSGYNKVVRALQGKPFTEKDEERESYLRFAHKEPIPLTFIVGVYGMNFKYMPELDEPWAYPAVWGLMLLITAGLVVFFRKRMWL